MQMMIFFNVLLNRLRGGELLTAISPQKKILLNRLRGGEPCAGFPQIAHFLLNRLRGGELHGT